MRFHTKIKTLFRTFPSPPIIEVLYGKNTKNGKKGYTKTDKIFYLSSPYLLDCFKNWYILFPPMINKKKTT